MSFLWGHSFIEGIAETRDCQKNFVQAGELNFCSPDLGAEAWRCYMGMGQYLLIPFLVGWTSIYQLFWGSLGTGVLTHPHIRIQCFTKVCKNAVEVFPPRHVEWCPHIHTLTQTHISFHISHLQHISFHICIWCITIKMYVCFHFRGKFQGTTVADRWMQWLGLASSVSFSLRQHLCQCMLSALHVCFVFCLAYFERKNRRTRPLL
jgi:hypothetical protein